jgi:predicted transcriptional regulator
MHLRFFLVVCSVIVALALAGCSREEGNPVHRVSASTSEMSVEIFEAISKYGEAGAELKSCEKYSTNAQLQCAEFKVKLARSAADLCGLQTKRAILQKIIENQGESRGLQLSIGQGCELD